MRNDRLIKGVKLMVALADDKDTSINDLCDKIELSHRSFYYYLDYLRDAGFVVFKHNGCYHIDHRSPTLLQLSGAGQLTGDEVRTIYNLLNMMGTANTAVNDLRRKLESTYDLSIIVDTPAMQRLRSIASRIAEAISRRVMLRIVGYSSPHSHTKRDRLVEPFLMMNGGRDVRCNEVSSAQNKTFKLARMESVEVLDTPWVNAQQHRQMFTDVFMFSGEERTTVDLRLGLLSHNLFLEEYPQASRAVTQEDDYHWRLQLDVCSYRGIGRFVMGLIADIDIVAPDSFRDYIQKQLSAAAEKLAAKS